MPPVLNIDWLLKCEEPWTRLRTLKDLLDAPDSDPRVITAKTEMIQHPQVIDLIEQAATWPGYALKRHNDARHPLYVLGTLADFGLKHGDHPDLDRVVESVLEHQSPQGAFQTLTQVSKSFGGTGEDQWSWMNCDAPTLLYILLSFGLDDDLRVQRAIAHLAELADENGWRCTVAPDLGNFRGPGRKSDPCPIANVYALKALALVNDVAYGQAIHRGISALLDHWERQTERKIYLFGIGTDFRKLKYPFVWYDILHVTDVLSLFPSIYSDLLFQEMLATITLQADAQGRYTAESMYMAWKGWSFANKKEPSPWLSLLVYRILKRVGELEV